MNEILLSAILAVNILGGAGVVVWLRRHIVALQGAVNAQKQTLDTVQSLNQTALQVIQVMDSERWMREIENTRRAADIRIQDALEEARRRAEREREASTQAASQIAVALTDRVEAYLRAALHLMVFVPQSERRHIIERIELPADIRDRLLRFGESMPDLSQGARVRSILLQLRDET